MKRILVLAAVLVGVILAAPAWANHSQSTGINCSNFATQEDAQAYFDLHPGDPEGLDGPPGPAFAGIQNVACEELPHRATTTSSSTTTVVSTTTTTALVATAVGGSTSSGGAAATGGSGRSGGVGGAGGAGGVAATTTVPATATPAAASQARPIALTG